MSPSRLNGPQANCSDSVDPRVHLVVATEHRESVIATADAIIDLA